ncbi:hypothetical protein WJX72_011872 [[Myrmecia] bisecta]|uniref:Protein kinase domain-containing protein n=1 Tax=[Myrmecia] bisecta TaxID=41462 RepID=A0AAW1P7V4_9CHLO
MPLCSQGILRQTSGGSMPLTDWLIPEDELEMCKRPDGLPLLLGAGAFGKVYKAMKDGTQPVAVKIIIDQTHKQQMDFEREINMLSCLRDRNIVQFLGVCLDGDETMLVTEFMENGDLYRMISKDRERTLCWYTRKSTAGRPTFGMGRRIALDIARGLHFLHSRRIVHFDLKSPNVLLARNNTAKIADVGLAKILKDGFISTAQHEVGTFVWMAPECLMGKRCTEKVDIFSFAVILWEICTGLVPQRGQMRSVRVPEECPAAIADLIERGMDSDPDNRPTAKEIVKVLMMQDAVLREKLAKATPPKQSGEVQATRSPSQDLAESLSNAHVHFAAQVAHNCSNGAPGTQLFNQGVSSLMECGRWYSRMNHDLEQCLKQPDAQVEDSPAHHRMAELCEAAMAHRAEVNRLAPRWFRRFEMVRLEDSAAAKQDTQPPVHHWSNVASALQLTENQLSELLAKHRDVIFRLDQVKQQRQQLVTALQSGLTSDVSDSHYAAATAYMDGKDAGDALNQCLEQERTIQEQLWTLMVNSLSVVQMATARVVSHPWIPDILAIMNSLALDAASVR